MPPKPKITKDMVIEAGFRIVRKEGEQALNVRKAASVLGCSTQPVMYHFSTVNELKAAVFEYADKFHTQYILTPDESAGDPFMAIGLRYIRFAHEEKPLFRLLFQSDKFSTVSFKELINSDYTMPVIGPLCELSGLTAEQAKEVFGSIFICAHGAADMLANNSFDYDEEYFKKLLKSTLIGLVYVEKNNIESLKELNGGE